MFGLLIVDSFYEQLLKSKFSLTEISKISELIRFTTINCINVNDFNKFRLLTIIVKSHWIYLSLAYITHPCIKCDDVEITNLDFIAKSVNDDIVYLDKHLAIIRETEEEKSIKNRITIFEGFVNKIKKIIDSGGEKSWEFYLEEFLTSLIAFQGIYSIMFPPSLLQQIIQSLAKWQNESELNMLRKLKLMLANQVQCKQELDKFCFFLTHSSEINLLSDLSNPNSEIFIKNKGNEMQESFKKYQEFANILKLEMKICYKCSTRHKVNLDSDSNSVSSCQSISINLYPVTSTPIRAAHSPMKNILPSIKTVDPDPPTIKMQTRSSLSLSEGKESTVSKEKTKISTGRLIWTLDETYLIYKGIQEKLQWWEIKNKYFKKSKRTNINMKDRWRTVLLKPDLMNQLENLYQNEFTA